VLAAKLDAMAKKQEEKQPPQNPDAIS
jgi:hypothetical protein